MTEMTDRQAEAWPGAVDVLNRAIEADYLGVEGGHWEFHWEEEIRPGRGSSLDARWNDGEVFAQITMDVYGRYNASIADLHWVHTPMEDCDCVVCEAERAEDDE